jgi:hypothetical protein
VGLHLTPRRWWWIAVQLSLGATVGVVAWATIVRNWNEFRSLDVAIGLEWPWIVASALVMFGSYVVSVEAWRQILAGWDQHLRFPRALRIWLIASLGRYVPGKVWSVAGLIVLAQRGGVATWAAGASAIALHAVAIGTAVVVVAVATPGAVSPLRLGVAALAALLTIGALTWTPLVRHLGRILGQGAAVRPLPVGAVARSAVLGVMAWLVHGLAFWMLAHGLGLPPTLTLRAAAGAFCLGYMVGLLAVFAPGGIGVREVVLIGILAPALGSGGAVALTVASRLVLTATEVLAPLATLVLTRNPREDIA